ncbi:hypothetical protein CPAR01_09992, partial [Colletotrichum paranaense]
IRLTDGQLVSAACTAAPQLTLSRVLPPISHHATSRSSHLGSSHRGTAMHLGLDDVYHWVSFPIERGRFFRSRLLHATSIPCCSLDFITPSDTGMRKRGQQRSTPHHDNGSLPQMSSQGVSRSGFKRQAEA